MVRHIIALVVAVGLAVGGLFAEEIKGVFKKYEGGQVTITVDGKEKTYKVDQDAKIKFKTKTGDEKEVALTGMMERMKEGRNMTLTVEKDVVVSAKAEFGKKKDKDKDKDK
jgi:hypothetical protein